MKILPFLTKFLSTFKRRNFREIPMPNPKHLSYLLKRGE